jgi:hypothetical protein
MISPTRTMHGDMTPGSWSASLSCVIDMVHTPDMTIDTDTNSSFEEEA